MRSHGWHLPYHPLQIVAVAVFSALVFSFYVFFVPFVGSSVLKFHVIAIFSPLVLAVFFCYVRCAAIDPADSGIKRSKQRAGGRKSEPCLETGRGGEETLEQMEEVSRMNMPGHESNGWVKPGKIIERLCCPFLVIWKCIPGTRLLENIFLGRQTDAEEFIPDEELLFCSLCEAEILKSSKHCRACDKCVDGFDHHCRWLNNCIGKKNYKTFVAVMVSTLLMLVMECCIGILVLVRCFASKQEFNKEIEEKLGSSFTRTPFVVVLTLCTFLAMLATLPLTQLLFFHIILMQKGITTYDYIVAIREQEAQEPAVEAQVCRTPSSSPANSVATAMSGGSSVGALHRAVWCTPPRMFVENQSDMKAGVVQYVTSARGMSPGMDPENGGGVSSRPIKHGHQKRQIGLSPWKLALLSKEQAAKAASRARENSSILHPVKYLESSAVTETEDSSFESSAEASGICTTSGVHKVCWTLDVPGFGNKSRNPLFDVLGSADLSNRREDKCSRAVAPLQTEARSPFRSRSLNTDFPTTANSMESPDNLGSPDLAAGDVHLYHTASQERSWLHRATSDGYEASGGESADDGASDRGRHLSQAWSKLKPNSYFIESSALEDAEPSQAQPSSRASSETGGSRVEANILRHVRNWPGVRDKVATSTDGSNNSSPSQYASPQQRMSPDIQSVGEIGFSSHLSAKEPRSTLFDMSPAGGEPKPTTGKKGLSSAKRLKESLLLYRRGLSSSSQSGGPLLSE